MGITILNSSNAIVLDTPRIVKHERTTPEVVECLKDLRVLGMKELRMLKKWRDALKKEVEDEELAEVDKQIAELKDEERRAARRMKKKELKAKQKHVEKINLKMIIPGDEGPTATEE